jgi:sialic acid synthase SpsE
VPVGTGKPTYVIAEIGSNHDRDLSQAKTLIDEAIAAGADAVKFQTFRYEDLFHDETNDSETREFYEEAALPFDWHAELQAYAQQQGTTFLSTPTHPEAVDLLERLDLPAYKVGSPQVSADPDLIADVASLGKPMLISSGLGGYGPVENALDACLVAGLHDVAVLHCISEYPTDPSAAQLRRIARLNQAFGTIVGYSDHTQSYRIPVAAVSLGADIVEKHFTVDRNLEGPDHSFALEPPAFEEMVDGIREVEAALGHGLKYGPSESETEMLEQVKLKLVADEPLPSGTPVTPRRVRLNRSPEGLPRELLSQLVADNVVTATDLESGDLIRWQDITDPQ